jgi:hypothetical protein
MGIELCFAGIDHYPKFSELNVTIHRPLRSSRGERKERDSFSRFLERRNREKHQLFEHDVGEDNLARSPNSRV